MHFNKIFLVLIILVCGVNGLAQSGWTAHYKIYDTKNKQTITITGLAAAVEPANVLFFGEVHNDSIGHRLQDTLYKVLLSMYGTVTLSMEMFERDCQQVVDEYLGDFITDERLVKEGRAWGNYKDYRPMVNTAKQGAQHVIAANAPRRYVNMISRLGLNSLEALPRKAKTHFASLPIDTLNKPYYERFVDIMGGHMPNNNVYYAQSMWDATMAESVYRYWKKNKTKKILHLIGRFHTDYQLGTFTQLQRRAKKLRIQNISCFPADDFSNPDWSKYERLGDYVILTDPGVPRSY